MFAFPVSRHPPRGLVTLPLENVHQGRWQSFPEVSALMSKLAKSNQEHPLQVQGDFEG